MSCSERSIMLYDHPNGEQYLNTTEADNSYVIHFRVTQHGTFIFIRPNNLSRGASSYVALSRNTTRFPTGISTLIFPTERRSAQCWDTSSAGADLGRPSRRIRVLSCRLCAGEYPVYSLGRHTETRDSPVWSTSLCPWCMPYADLGHTGIQYSIPIINASRATSIS